MEKDRLMKMAKHMAEDAEMLLYENLDKVEERAMEAMDENDDKPVVAKVSINFEWPAGAQAPLIKAKFGNSVKWKAETERVFDPNQAQLKFE